MSDAIQITLIVVGGIVGVFLMGTMALVPLYAYYRALSRSSPLPPILERVANPPETVSKPHHSATCNGCGKRVNFILSGDERLWICPNCARAVDGPKPVIRS